MPVYATIYLAIFLLFAFGTTYIRYEEKRGILFILTDSICFLFLISFVLMYYNRDKMVIDGEVILAMIMFCIGWAIYTFRLDFKTAREKFGLETHDIMLATAISTLFMLPPFYAAFELVKK